MSYSRNNWNEPLGRKDLVLGGSSSLQSQRKFAPEKRSVIAMSFALCQPPNAATLRSNVTSFRPSRTSHPPAKPARTPPRSLTLPPQLALPVIALFSTHPVIPPTLRDAPTSFLATSLLSNLSLLPDSHIPDIILHHAPAALTLLLLHPSRTPPKPELLTAFLLGVVGTTLGALIAFYFVPHPALAAAFAATYIGGSANFVAVADALSLPKGYTGAAMSVDLAAMTVYFGALFALAAPLRITQSTAFVHPMKSQSRLLTVVTPLFLTTAIVLFIRALKLPSTVNLLLTTVLATMISSIPRVQPFLSETPRLSSLALNLFFAALGATARLSAVASASSSVCVFAAVVLTVHAVFLYLVGAIWLRIPTRELLLASNANVGGASTAAAFAACLGWRSLVHGAVAVGTLGYVLGTPIALLIFRILGGAAV